MNISRGLLGTGMAASAAIGVYRGIEQLYTHDLERRLPEGGDEESIFPYLENAFEVSAQLGLRSVLMGGPAKQALLDPETIIDPVNRKLIVAKGACRTREKATLYRPGEHTLRDIDLFVTALEVDNSWQDALPVYDNILNKRAADLQTLVNTFALNQRSFPKGPEISLFGYEEPQGNVFSIKHYATRTQLKGSTETISHSLGAHGEFEQSPIWTLCVDDLELPTCSPVRLLGRTLNRTLLSRQRDLLEVHAGAQNIINMGLGRKILGDDWEAYQKLRRDLDKSARPQNIFKLFKNQDIHSAKNLVAARMLAPLATGIEQSFIGTAIRDPESIIARLAAKIMGAHDTARQQAA